MNALETMAGFLDLSTELQFKLAEYLDPLDVKAVGDTCRTLYTVMSTRSIWENKLRRTLKLGGIPEATLSVPICEMDVVELRSHCRWDMLMSLLGRSRAPLKPENTHILDDGVFGVEDQTSDYARLVPGGRYAISKSDETIKLWDLGPICGPKERQGINLVDSSNIEDGQGYISWISPLSRSTRDTLCFVAIIAGGNPTVQVYEIDPVDGDCKLQMLGRLQFPRLEVRWDDTGMTGDLVYVRYDGALYIWDYCRSLITSLIPHGDYTATFIGNGIGVEMDGSAVYGWRVPSLHPLTPNFSVRRPEATPLMFELPIPDDAGEGSEYHLVDVSLEKTGLHITFDMARARHTWGTANQTFDIHRFVLKADSNTAPTLSRYSETFDIPKPHLTSKLTYLYNTAAPRVPVVLQDGRWDANSRLFQYIYSTDMEPGGATHSTWVAIPIHSAIRKGVVCDLTLPCPVSGRMVVVSHEPPHPRAYVFDFYPSGQ
ncbi:hypothetical protein DFP72DRAFT_1076953 [Ephemerocybe angulata]|uniref:F-box domain-containing protein n=1 Tax=Ephemerocybe angulata TaxID=980116 RepID=A0A8H6LXK2_9AGAR|nr:hypothetical protein DFP72DRAFT_1076953 [Tulosesus angulatus]